MSLYLQLYLTVADITEKYYFKVHCIFKFHNLLYESDHDHELFLHKHYSFCLILKIVSHYHTSCSQIAMGV